MAIRFDDMLETVLAMDASQPAQQRAQWQQLTDLLGQRGERMKPELVAAALRQLALLKRQVPVAQRAAAARAVARRARFAPLVAFYALDDPGIARDMLLAAPIADEEWIALLPSLSPVARNLLRQREGLSPSVKLALASYGPSDFQLPGAVAPAAADRGAAVSDPRPVGPLEQGEQDDAEAPDPAASFGGASQADQISTLVERIESYRAARAAQRLSEEEPPPDRQRARTAAPYPRPRSIAQFTFETGADGLIRSVMGARRGTIIGLSIAEAAYGEEPGTDASSAGAFRQRADIVNARLRLEGDPSIAGEWRFSAIPLFDPTEGRFLGYHARARRPRLGESAHDAAIAQQGRDDPADAMDAMRQLLHELKTPLNAISGFAQIIAAQYFGPVGQRYRAMADAISQDAEQLQTLFADVEQLVRRGDGGSAAAGGSGCDARAVLLRISDALQPVTESRNVDVVIGMPETPVLLAASEHATARIFMRLLTALLDVTARGESLRANLASSRRADQPVTLSVSLPTALHGLSEVELLDPDSASASDSPASSRLALAFSLRLVDALVRENKGETRFAPERIAISLPASATLAEISEVQR